MHKLRQWWQVVKLYFPKYIDKVVIIENERLTVVDEFQYLGHITKKKGGWGVVITTHHLQRSISQI
jgi:hypothetical protein